MTAIAGWLASIGLSEYAERFVEKLGGPEQDLKELGVLLGHRRKMLRAIAELKGGGHLSARRSSRLNRRLYHLAEAGLFERAAEQLFAATVGEDDVRLFKYHAMEDNRTPGRQKWNGVEIRVDSKINFDWSCEYEERPQARRAKREVSERVGQRPG